LIRILSVLWVDIALTRKVENQLEIWLKDEATQAYAYVVLV
jgi:hypothetical protein